jgi:hypothetical protein
MAKSQWEEVTLATGGFRRAKFEKPTARFTKFGMTLYGQDTFQKGDTIGILKNGEQFAIVADPDGRKLGGDRRSKNRLAVNCKNLAEQLDAEMKVYLSGSVEKIDKKDALVFPLRSTK